VTYLDTGCFVTLYYPEPDSTQVVALIQGKPLCYTPLHELEFGRLRNSRSKLKSIRGRPRERDANAASSRGT
jgi:hypothetical protein